MQTEWPSGLGRHGGLLAFHADRLGPTRQQKGEIMPEESSSLDSLLDRACQVLGSAADSFNHIFELSPLSENAALSEDVKRLILSLPNFQQLVQAVVQGNLQAVSTTLDKCKEAVNQAINRHLEEPRIEPAGDQYYKFLCAPSSPLPAAAGRGRAQVCCLVPCHIEVSASFHSRDGQDRLPPLKKRRDEDYIVHRGLFVAVNRDEHELWLAFQEYLATLDCFDASASCFPEYTPILVAGLVDYSKKAARHYALGRFFEILAHMRAWGSSEYDYMPEADRESFRAIVTRPELLSYVTDCIQEVQRTGTDVPDDWFQCLDAAAHLNIDSPLSRGERDHLGRILDALRPMLLMFDPFALPSAQPVSTIGAPTSAGMPDQVNRNVGLAPLPGAKPGQSEGNGGADAVGLTRDCHSKSREMRKVFISYSHDSAAHCERVLQLANTLRSHGVDVELDRYHVRPPDGWPLWCEKQLRPENSKFVLMICTETYRRRVEDKVPADEGRGVFWEGGIIFTHIYSEKGNTRFIPVLLPDATPDCIPVPIRNHTRYQIGQFDLVDDGYLGLYRELTEQPAVSKPALGQVVTLVSPPTTATAAPLEPRPVETTFPTPVGSMFGNDTPQTLQSITPWSPAIFLVKAQELRTRLQGWEGDEPLGPTQLGSLLEAEAWKRQTFQRLFEKTSYTPPESWKSLTFFPGRASPENRQSGYVGTVFEDSGSATDRQFTMCLLRDFWEHLRIADQSGPWEYLGFCFGRLIDQPIYAARAAANAMEQHLIDSQTPEDSQDRRTYFLTHCRIDRGILDSLVDAAQRLMR